MGSCYCLKQLRLRLTKPLVTDDDVESVKQVLDSGWLTEGEVTTRFEHAVASYTGAKHAVAFCNATAAMEMCLRAFNPLVFGPSDEMVRMAEVYLPSFTHPATIRAVVNAGKWPVFVDVDLESRNATYPELHLEYSFCLPVSWGGHPFTEAPRKQMEDAACSLGASYNGRKVGDGSHPTCFSFHPRKIVTTGEGGMVTTDSGELAEKLRDLKHFAHGNYKLSDINAAIGLTQMDKINWLITRRREMAHIYSSLLEDTSWVQTPCEAEGACHTYQTYAVYLWGNVDRDRCIMRLKKKGIETQVGAYALHILPECSNVPRVSDLRNSEALARHLLALPMSYDMTEEDQKRVVYELEACHT